MKNILKVLFLTKSTSVATLTIFVMTESCDWYINVKELLIVVLLFLNNGIRNSRVSYAVSCNLPTMFWGEICGKCHCQK